MRENLDDNPTRRFLRAIKGSGSCFPIFGLFRAQQLARSSLHQSHYYGSDRALITEMLLFGKFRIDESATFNNRFHQQQSISIENRSERALWQGDNTSRISSLERINLLVHLVKIAGKNPNLAPRLHLYMAVAKYALRPIEITRYLIEIVQFFSPPLGTRLRTAAKWLRGKSSKYRQARNLPDEEN